MRGKMKRLIYLLAIVSLASVFVSCTKDNSLKITLDASGGAFPGGLSSQEIIADGNTFDMKVPIREGYEFSGWNNTEALNPKAKEITLYAKWEIKKFTVKFVDFDDAIISTQTVAFNEPATAPENPERRGDEEKADDKSKNKGKVAFIIYNCLFVYWGNGILQYKKYEEYK
jgi:uncharacterized repeat protein (TIGR02543 family)